MRWAIGDLQGCQGALDRLLERLAFQPGRDELWLCGDLINRGPESLGTLRRVLTLGDAVRCVLGNHDLHTLAVAAGVRPPHRSDTIQSVLTAPDAEDLLDWLRAQPLIQRPDRDTVLVHAGLLPEWPVSLAEQLAAEVSALLRSPDWRKHLRAMYGNQPDQWEPDLAGEDRMRVIVNAMTRLRFCSADGQMEFKTKDGSDQAPTGFMPWFRCPGRRSADHRIIFGHWSTLGLIVEPNLVALDTGCVWGGQLTAYNLDDHRIVQVQCDQACTPG